MRLRWHLRILMLIIVLDCTGILIKMSVFTYSHIVNHSSAIGGFRALTNQVSEHQWGCEHLLQLRIGILSPTLPMHLRNVFMTFQNIQNLNNWLTMVKQIWSSGSICLMRDLAFQLTSTTCVLVNMKWSPIQMQTVRYRWKFTLDTARRITLTHQSISELSKKAFDSTRSLLVSSIHGPSTIRSSVPSIELEPWKTLVPSPSLTTTWGLKMSKRRKIWW